MKYLSLGRHARGYWLDEDRKATPVGVGAVVVACVAAVSVWGYGFIGSSGTYRLVEGASPVVPVAPVVEESLENVDVSIDGCLAGISIAEPEYRLVVLPERSRDFKSYMDYHAIKKWAQYDLQKVAYDGNYGIRMVNGRYCVAVGTGCGCEIGQWFDLVLENGTVIECVCADIKKDEHTDESNLVTVANECVSEFLVNSKKVEGRVLRSGSISNVCDEWKSPVVEIHVYDTVENF